MKFKLVVIIYPALRKIVSWYLSDRLSHVADMPSRRWLWSSTSNQLTVRQSCLVTDDERSFASAGPKLWNSLPDNITSASSL